MAAHHETLPIATTWYETVQHTDDLTQITEPHVLPLLAANTWVLRGDTSDLFIDCGLGVASLREHLPELFERDPALVATHGHLDHMGSASEFSEVWAHEHERVDLDGMGSLDPHRLATILGAPPGSFGDDTLIAALPHHDYDHSAYTLRTSVPTRALSDGDVIDLGGTELRVLHMPGHTRGSICLYEPDRKWLFTGDVIYDEGGDMIDYFTNSSPSDYRQSMRTLMTLDAETVFAGHGPVMNGDRLKQLAERYLSLDSTAPRTNAYN